MSCEAPEPVPDVYREVGELRTENKRLRGLLRDIDAAAELHWWKADTDNAHLISGLRQRIRAELSKTPSVAEGKPRAVSTVERETCSEPDEHRMVRCHLESRHGLLGAGGHSSEPTVVSGLLCQAAC